MNRTSQSEKPNQAHRGFTLLEIMIVLVVIALVTAGGFVVVPQQLKKARDSKRQTEIHELQVALEAYYTDHQHYPEATGHGGRVPGGGADVFIFHHGPFTSEDGLTVYLKSTPQDPKADNPFLYVYNATPSAKPSSYDICAFKLEVVESPPEQDESFCLRNLQ